MDFETFLISYFIWGLAFGLASALNNKSNIFIKILIVLIATIIWFPYSIYSILKFKVGDEQ